MFQRQFQTILSAGADSPLIIMIIIKLLYICQRYSGGKSEEFMGNTEHIHDSKVVFLLSVTEEKMMYN